MRGNRAEQHEAPTYTAMSPEQVPNIVKHTSFNQSRHRNVRVASLDPMPRDGELRSRPDFWRQEHLSTYNNKDSPLSGEGVASSYPVVALRLVSRHRSEFDT